MPIILWIVGKITGKLALPLVLGLAALNLASGAGLLITRHTLHLRTVERDAAVKALDQEKDAHAADIQKVKDTSAAALAADKLHAVTVEGQQSQITEDSQDADSKALTANRALAVRWMRAHPPGAAVRSGSAKDLPAAPDAAGPVDGSPTYTVVSFADIDACTQAYTVAKGWKDWWAKEAPVMKAGAAPSVSLNEGVVGMGAGTRTPRDDVGPGPEQLAATGLDIRPIAPAAIMSEAVPDEIAYHGASGSGDQNEKAGDQDMHRYFLP